MSKQLPFLVYCIEVYKQSKGLSGKAAIDVFSRYDVLSYIRDSYEALHTTGPQYIVSDIDAYIAATRSA